VNARDSERGFVVATVLVFLVVLGITAFFAARLTRSDIQGVSNLQNERRALFVAESGVNEALYRLRLASPACVPISGLSAPAGWAYGTCPNGQFDASLLTKYRASCPSGTIDQGSSPYGLDSCVVGAKTQVLFNATTTGAPAGPYITTPTLQTSPYALKYSTASSDFVTNPPANLQVEWDVCTAQDVSSALYGCTAAGTQIRQYAVPGCTQLRNILKMTSTGALKRADGSIVASRRVVARAADTGTHAKGLPTIITSLDGCGQGINMNGGARITTAGGIQVNSGAGTISCPTNSQSITGGNNNSITACTAFTSDPTACGFGVSGAGVDSHPTYAPNPIDVKSEPAIDPFNDPQDPTHLLSPPGPFNSPPSLAALTSAGLNTSPSGCAGTAAAPQTCDITTATTLSPGIYWGGIAVKSADVTFAPGVYILAGGGLDLGNGSVTITTQTTGVGGVTFYNTNDPYHPTNDGSYGQFTFGGGSANVTLIAPTTNPTAPDGSSTNFKGVLLFQDRNNHQTVDMQGGSNGSYTVNGAIYAWDTPTSLQGHANGSISVSLVVGSLALTGNSNINIGNPTTATGACSSDGFATVAWQDF